MNKPKHIDINNRKALYDYELLDKYDTGIILKGTEIKSIRNGLVNLKDGFCFFKGTELFVKNVHIAAYEHGNIMNHEPLSVRKLLLTKRELHKLLTKVKERGYTIVPTRMYISERGFAKLEIALARGKKSFDKRNSIKQKDIKREMDRNDRY
jgi:SsrA-binding protein